MKRDSVILRKRNIFIALFLLLIVGISFGYARLETTLSITGDTKISKVGWLVHFKNIQVTEGSYQNNGANSAVIVDSDDTKVTYTVTLAQPGDFYEFTVDIVNDGTLDAKLNARRETGTDVTDVPFVEYSVDGLPALDSILKPGADNKKTVRIRVDYPEDINPTDLPAEDFTFTKTIELDYVQAR